MAMEIVTNPFFLVFFGGVLAAYISFRLSRNAKESALGELEATPRKKIILRKHIFSIFGILFLIFGFAGLGIFGTDFYFQNKEIFSMSAFQAGISQPQANQANTPVPPSETPAPTEVITKTPAPTQTPGLTPTVSATPTLTDGVIGPRVIGNTNFQGLNVRESPSIKAGIVARLVNGSEVLMLNEPTQETDGFTWQFIKLEDGTVGWVVSFHLLEQPIEKVTSNP